MHLIVNGMIAKRSQSLESQRDYLTVCILSSEAYRLRDMVLANPSLIGTKEDIKFLADANVDVWLSGNIDRSLPDDQQQLDPEVRQLADQLEAKGIIESTFNTNLFVSPDSRSSPATSGLAGAFMGSLFMMLIVIIISIPIGVASAIYLEEFAPKNIMTDIIEVNINNLAAVPSIVFGLLGAAIFIGWMQLTTFSSIGGWFGIKFNDFTNCNHYHTCIIKSSSTIDSSSCIRFRRIKSSNCIPSCITISITGHHDRFDYWCSTCIR